MTRRNLNQAGHRSGATSNEQQLINKMDQLKNELEDQQYTIDELNNGAYNNQAGDGGIQDYIRSCIETSQGGQINEIMG